MATEKKDIDQMGGVSIDADGEMEAVVFNR